MHALHARLPKHFVLEERLERYAAAIETKPETFGGSWRLAMSPAGADTPAFEQLHLDLGCGKGTFTCAMATAHPTWLFIGIDSEPICIAYAAQKAVEANLSNVVFVAGVAEHLSRYFGPGELDKIYLNFPTPFPKKREATLRLTHADQLISYREVLRPDGCVQLKTDSQPLYDFSLRELDVAGYKLAWATRDLHADAPASYTPEPQSGYEVRLAKKGARVHAFLARPSAEAGHIPNDVPMSLVEYLPQDLQNLDYVPHGMEGTVLNLKNRQTKRLARPAHKKH